MSFTLADLIIENSIRDGLARIRQAALATDQTAINEIIDVLFDFTDTGRMVRSIGPDGNRLPDELEGGIGSAVFGKYSQEKARLIQFFKDTEIAIVHAFGDVQTHLPCVSIQLAADGEDLGLALTDDFGGISGVDVTTVENALGRDENTIHANAVINVGIHTKEQLLTRYLYHVVKYTVLSNKLQLIRQNFIIATFRGSDFNRDSGWQGDHVYTRFLNISGKTEDTWVDINEIVAELDQIDLVAAISGVNATPAADTVPTDAPSSLVNLPAGITDGILLAGQTMLQVANSFYLPASGMATLVTRGPTFDTMGNLINESFITSTETVTITANDPTTNIITISPATTLPHLIISATDMVNAPLKPGTTERLPSFTSLISSVGATPETIQIIPTNAQNSQEKETDNNAAGVTHTSNIRT